MSQALARERPAVSVGALREACGADPRLAWERGVFDAFCHEDPAVRRALVNEQLLDFDREVRRWVHVPRVGARVAMSAGFLFAILAVIESATNGGSSTQAFSPSELVSAVTALAVGLAAASFCAAVHVRSIRALNAHLTAVDGLVRVLERTGDKDGGG